MQISQLFIQGTRVCSALSGSRVVMGVLHTGVILLAKKKNTINVHNVYYR